MLMKYKPMRGAIINDILTGSTVGVITAARTAIATIACRQNFNNDRAETIPNRDRMKMNKGNSKHNPTQNSKPVTKLK